MVEKKNVECPCCKRGIEMEIKDIDLRLKGKNFPCQHCRANLWANIRQEGDEIIIKFEPNLILIAGTKIKKGKQNLANLSLVRG